MTTHNLTLADGRTLSYAVYGPGDGEPVVYFHGTPSSKLEPMLLYAYGVNVEKLLMKFKLQIIAIDRPGMGESSFNPNGTFETFCGDVKALTDHLQIKKCSCIAWSGGGPFALSFASAFPNIVNGIFIITGFTLSMGDKEVFNKMHGNKLYFGAARRIPTILRWVMNIVLKRELKKGLPQWLSKLPKVDNDLMSEPQKLKALAESTAKEACRQGAKGAVYEAALYFNNYPFILSEIKQPVHFWWGTEDNAVIRMHAEAIEQHTPDPRMHYKQGEGHLSIYINYFEEVLHEISRAPR